MAYYASIGLMCLLACYALSESRLSKDNSPISVSNVLTKVQYGPRSLLTWKRKKTYFVTPLANFKQSSVRYKTLSDGSTKQLLFSIMLTDDAMRDSLVNYLRRYTGECVIGEQIEMVPINMLDVKISAEPGIHKRWTVSLLLNPETIDLKMDCQNALLCDLFKSILESNPSMEISFNVGGNHFKLPIITLNGSSSDVTKYDNVPCKPETQVNLRSIRENVEEMAEGLKQVVKSEHEAVRALHQITELLDNTKKKPGKGNSECLFEDSIILKYQKNGRQIRETLLELLVDVIGDFCWKRCYRAIEDNFVSSAFHRKCDFKGKTITILKTGLRIIGGYTDVSWGNGTIGNSEKYLYSNKSIIFSLTNATRMMSTHRPQYGIYTKQGFGPTFGGGHDLHISNDCRSNRNSYTNLGFTYKLPNGFSYATTKAKEFLAGSYKFSCSDYEVYYAIE